MSFQQSMYALYWTGMAIVAAGVVLTLLNDRKVEGLSYWLFFIAMPMFILGIPALLNQHVFNKNPHKGPSQGKTKHCGKPCAPPE